MADATVLPCALPGTPLSEVIAGIDTCVHCGFCLQACPTYVNLQDENDSPRGRILLMRSLVQGDVAVDDPAVRTHIDRCLGCRACETACPSGVPYGHLLEATRATLNQAKPNPFIARFILGVFRRPLLLHTALMFSKLARSLRLPELGMLLSGRLGFAAAMLASTRPRFGRTYAPPAATTRRGTVAMLRGCVMEGLYTHTNAATERVLATNGYSVMEAPGQQCCGALHAHAGDLVAAREMARVNVAAFEASGADYIAVNAAGCGAMVKEYGQLLSTDPAWKARAESVSARARDVSELLAEAGPEQGGTLKLTVTYDAPCHLLHAQRIAAPPLKVLNAIPGLTLIPLVDADQCCGSAGIYNLVEPATSDAVLAPKLEHIKATKAAYVATGNPGCMMQIGAGLRRAHMPAQVIHPVDLLDASYAVKYGRS